MSKLRPMTLAAVTATVMLSALGSAGTAYAETPSDNVVSALPAGMTVLSNLDLSTIDTGATEEAAVITVTKPAGVCETYQTFTILTVNNPLSPGDKLVVLSAAVPTSEKVC